MTERISLYSDEDYGAPPVNSLTEAFGLSSTTKHAIFISVLFVILAQWKSSIKKWYRSVRFQLKHITIKEYLIHWWWTCIQYGRGAWYIGHEVVRNTFCILKGGTEDTKRNIVQMGSFANENRNRLSMPELLHDDQLSDALEQTAPDHRAQFVETRHTNGGRLTCSQMAQTIKEVQTTPRVEVEPAFNQERNYPPGWLVFHSRLGVVPKGVANEYDRRRHHLVGEASGVRRIDTQNKNVLFPHDSKSPAVSNNGPTSVTTA